MRIPAQIDFGTRHEMSMDQLEHTLRMHRHHGSEMCESDRYVCGHPLPPFQREACWDEARQVAFIESAWFGLPLGSYTYHGLDWSQTSDGCRADPMSGWLLDGQQRLTAIESYWDDKFPVFGLLWSELTHREKRRFMRIPFTSYEVVLWDEALCRDLYNRLALGGVAHQEHERA